MPAIPVMAFAAYSGTGKTTLIEKIIRCLKGRGIRLAVVKHDAHDFDIDHKGKDSWRFTQAGADVTVISSGTKTAVIEQRPRSIQEIVDRIEGVDLVLVEGYRNQNLPVIGICREETGKGFAAETEAFVALVTDGEAPACGIPCFGLEEVEAISDFILSYCGVRA